MHIMMTCTVPRAVPIADVTPAITTTTTITAATDTTDTTNGTNTNTNTNTATKQIFLSYSTKDIQFARYLYALLQDAGFTIWMDKTCLDAGMDWCDEIEKNLNACAAFVVIMSPDSQQSNFVKSEVFHAMDRDKPIFPILLAGEEPLFYLKAYQWEDMRGGLSATLSPSFVDSLKNKVLPSPLTVPPAAINNNNNNNNSNSNRVRLDIVQADVLTFDCDVLVFKHANGFMGCDAIVARHLHSNGITIDENRELAKGNHLLLPTNGYIGADNVLFVPTEGLMAFDYKSIRAFTLQLFEILAAQQQQQQQNEDEDDSEVLSCKHVAMTIHGVGFGLDEAEALMAELGGIMDCLNNNNNNNNNNGGTSEDDDDTKKKKKNLLCGVERISIIEINQNRVTRLRQTADEHFGELMDDSIAQKCEANDSDNDDDDHDHYWGYDLIARQEQQQTTPATVSQQQQQQQAAVPSSIGAQQQQQQQQQVAATCGAAKRVKPYALIITSDDESQEDIFYYGMQHPVHAMGLLCERVKIKCITNRQSDMTKHHLERMEDARVVVCDVSIISPMLYFYLGYAMGKNIPIVLVSKDEKNPHFDDEDAYDMIQYSKIWELEERLRQWLERTLKG